MVPGAVITMGLSFTGFSPLLGGGIAGYIHLLHGSFNAWLSTVWLLRADVDPMTLRVMALLVCLIAIGVIAVYGTEHLSRNKR